MKKIAILAVISLIFAACFNDWQGDEGNFSVIIGSSGNGRAVTNLNDIPIEDFRHIITLSDGPGVEQTGSIDGAGSLHFSVIPGYWTITVKAYVKDDNGIFGNTPLLFGSARVAIKAGVNGVVPIPLRLWDESEDEKDEDIKDFGPGAIISAIFDVATTEQWDEAISVIASGGNNKNYIINVKDNFKVARYSLATFGGVIGIKVSLRGADKTLSLLGDGNMLIIGRNQSVILRDVSLQGHEANNNALVYVDYGGTFTMNSGKISGNDGGLNVGGVYVSGGTFIMNSGKISGNDGGFYAGGVYLSEDGIFTMNGGEISGNTSSISLGGIGGGVYVSGGTFTMNKGKIFGNTAISSPFGGKGGGVYVSGGTFIMKGGEISGNTADSGGGVYVKGGEENFLSGYKDGGIFTMYGGEISDNTASEGGGVYAENGVSITGEDMTGKIFRIVTGTIHGSNAADTRLKNVGSEGAALYGNAEYGTFNGETWNPNGTLDTIDETIKVVNGVLLSGADITKPDGYVFNVANTANWNAAISAIRNGGNNKNYFINLTSDIEVTGSTSANFGNVSGVTVTLQGEGRTLSLTGNGNMLHIGSDQTVILQDLTLQGHDSNNDSLVAVWGGTFTMNSGGITGNTSTGNGGGVFVYSDGNFIMHGGEISGNMAAPAGAGVNVDNGGTFTMKGGKITSNTATTAGGGVRVARGIFTMENGEISGNTVTGGTPGGGGVSVGSSGTFIMQGGKISGNNADYGGGVSMTMGTFTMNTGEISGNTASSYGGGVLVSGGTFTKTGGTITGYVGDPVNGNVVKDNDIVLDDRGHAVFVNSEKRREITAGPDDNLDSDIDGPDGGWEEEPDDI